MRTLRLLLWVSAVAALASILVNFRVWSVGAIVSAVALLAILRELKVERDDPSESRRMMRLATSCALGLFCVALAVGGSWSSTFRLVALTAVCIGVAVLAGMDIFPKSFGTGKAK